MKKILIISALLLNTLFAFSQVKYQYDNLYRLEKVEYPNGTTVEYKYDELGNRQTKTVSGTIVVTDVNLNKTTTTLSVNGTEQLIVTVTPDNATNIVTWSTNSPSVAIVDNGLVKGISVGTAIITVSAGDSKTATCEVTVVSNDAAQCNSCPDFDYSIAPTAAWNIVNGDITSNGCKTYKFSATQGSKYTFKTGCGDNATANFDTWLYLYNSNCNYVIDDDQGCSNNLSKIENWECPVSGDYYLQVKGYNDNQYGNYTLAYKITDNVIAGSCKPCSEFDWGITPNTEWNADSWNITSGECRIYRFFAAQGARYTFKTGCGDDATADFDTWLYLYDSNCDYVIDDDQGCSGNLSKIEDWECPVSGNYYLQVKGYNNNEYGDYTLAYKKTKNADNCKICPEYDWSITPTTNWNIANGDITQEGCKIYRFTATQGSKYTFKTGCGDDATADFDTWLYLYDSNCNYVIDDDNQGCFNNLSKIEDWECPVSGNYYLQVKGYNTNQYGNYTLVYKKTETLSNDATLRNLTVSFGDLLFDVNTTSYTLNVSNDVTSIDVIGTANHEMATVTGNVTGKPLDVGDNGVEITVTAEDGTVKTYTVTIHRVSNDATLRSLTVSSGDLLFDANTTDYTVNVYNNVTGIDVTGTANHAAATVIGNVTGKPLEVGDNVVNITVTAENGTVKTYTVTIRRLSNDATLSSLTVSVGDLSFDANTTSYTVNVSNDVTSITVTGTANHANATVIGNVTGKTLEVGDNVVNITVTAEDGTTTTYTVTVVRAASSDATLKSLTVSAGSLSFDANTTSYTVNVSNNVTNIIVTGMANHANATVTSNVTDKQLNVGNNVINITVTAEDGTTKTYTVTVVRENAVIILTAFSLDNNANIALSRTVDLGYTFSGGVPTEYIAGEKPDLSGSEWKTYNPAELRYSFASDEHGIKTVYTRLRNDKGETVITSDVIYYKPFHEINIDSFDDNYEPQTRSIDVLYDKSIHIYPNPVETYANITIDNVELPEVKVEVYSLTGKMYLSQKFTGSTFSLDMSRYPSGIFLVKFIMGDAQVTKRIIKL
jgi:YD repeat-containing protein